MATVPTVAAVATLEPEVAENKVDAPMLACIKPPGNHDSHRLIALYMRSAKPARSSTSPSMMNSGIATSRNSLFELQEISPMARVSGNIEKSGSRIRPNTPSAAPTGMDSPISTSNNVNAVEIMLRLP